MDSTTNPASRASLAELVLLALENRRKLARGMLFGAVVGAVLGLTTPRRWTSVVTFVPSADENTAGSLLGVAAQFGVSLPGASPQQSPSFYARLISSDRVLFATAKATYSIHPRGWLGMGPADSLKTGNLADFLEITGKDPETVIAKTARRLAKEHLAVAVDDETGITTLAVTTQSPDLSAQIAGRILALVQEFDTDTRQSQAGAERRFTSERLLQAESALASAESAVEAFLMNNQQFRSVSRLQLQLERLQREVTMRQQVVIGLRQAYEQARIEEVRNTPQLTIIDRGDPARIPQPRGLVLKVVLGSVAGAGVVILGLFIRLMTRAAATNPASDEARIVVALRELLSDMRRRVRSSGQHRNGE